MTSKWRKAQKKYPSETMVIPSHPTNMHLELLNVGNAAFPKLWKYTFAFLLYSSTNPASWVEEELLWTLCSTFIQHCKLEIF